MFFFSFLVNKDETSLNLLTRGAAALTLRSTTLLQLGFSTRLLLLLLGQFLQTITYCS